MKNMTDVFLPSAEEAARHPAICMSLEFCGCKVRQENCFSLEERARRIAEDKTFLQAVLSSDCSAAEYFGKQ